MNQQSQKWVTMSILAFSILITYVTFAALFKLAGVYDFETRVKNLDLTIQMVSLGVGFILFLILYRSQAVNQFLHESVTELSRVTWPTIKETYASTFVTVIMILLTGILLGVMDKIWEKVIQLVL